MRGRLGIPTTGSSVRRRTRHGLGAEESVSPVVEEKPSPAETVKQFLPLVKNILVDDATEDVKTLQAKIANHKRIRNTFPRGTPMWVLYDNRINVLEAKLKAARKREVEEAQDRASKWEWTRLGKTGLTVGIVAGVGLTYLLFRAGNAQRARGSYYSAKAAKL